MVDTYILFGDFNIFVSKDDQTQVDNLRFNFDQMLAHVRNGFSVFNLPNIYSILYTV